MTVDFQTIQDKQRIVIIGNEGTLEIAKITAHILRALGKPFDYLLVDGSNSITDAPIILIQGNDQKAEGSTGADFLKFRHHIAVIHHIEDSFPEEYNSFDEYLDQYERLADQTPKGGTILYNKEDNLAMVISEKEREDVHLIEYESINLNQINGTNKHDENFALHAGAVKGLLRRMSVPEEDILKALSTYQS